MGLYELYEELRKYSDEELIEDWDWATDEDGVWDTISVFIAEVNVPIRDIIEERGLDKLDIIKKYDQRLIREVLKIGQAACPSDRERGIINPPLEKWWWYLDLIAERKYPAELLPDYLRETYEGA